MPENFFQLLMPKFQAIKIILLLLSQQTVGVLISYDVISDFLSDAIYHHLDSHHLLVNLFFKCVESCHIRFCCLYDILLRSFACFYQLRKDRLCLRCFVT